MRIVMMCIVEVPLLSCPAYLWATSGVPGLICASEEETHWNEESEWHEANGISPSRW